MGKIMSEVMSELETGCNLLEKAEKTLPSHYYYDQDHYERELTAIWYKNWVYVCRADEMNEPRSFKTVDIGDQNILVFRDDDGQLRAFHNVCRHRGSRLVAEKEGTFKSKMIVCAYHAWCYEQDGSLKATSSKTCPANFKTEDHSLFKVAITNWNGFIFINLAGEEAKPIEECIKEGSADLTNWDIASLKVGHKFTKLIDCNWKIFWENYNECLHCPGVHKSLVKLVPIYKRGIMEPKDDPNWRDHIDSNDPKFAGGMRSGAHSWTNEGQPVGPTFPGLNEKEIKNAHNFLDLLPTIFLSAHVDYIRCVSVLPKGPEQTEVYIQWLFLPQTLDDPEADITPAIELASRVLLEDAFVSELNQKGMRSIAYDQGTLMPEEYGVAEFKSWVLDQLK